MEAGVLELNNACSACAVRGWQFRLESATNRVLPQQEVLYAFSLLTLTTLMSEVVYEASEERNQHIYRQDLMISKSVN